MASTKIHIERDGEPWFTSTHEDVSREDVRDKLANRATHLRLEYAVAPDDPREHAHWISLE